MNLLSCSYDTLFLNLWPLIAGVLLSWHCGLVNAQGGPDLCNLFFLFPPHLRDTLFLLHSLWSFFLELGRV